MSKRSVTCYTFAMIIAAFAALTTAAARGGGRAEFITSEFASLLSVRKGLPALADAPAATFTSTQSGSWGDASTWGGAGVPGAADNVVISSGNTVTENGDRACADLTVNGTLDMTNNFLFFDGVTFTNNGSLISSTGSGELRFNGVGGAGGTMQAMAGFSPYNSAMPVDLRIVQQTTVTPAAGTIIGGLHTFTIDGGSTLSLANGLTIRDGVTVNNSGVINGSGILRSQGPAAVNSGNMTAPLEAVSGTTTCAGTFGAVTVDGGATLLQSNQVATNGNLNVTAGATLSMANQFLFFQGNTFTNNGSIISNNGNGELRFNGVGGAGGTTQALAGTGTYTLGTPADLHIVQQTTVIPASGTIIDGARFVTIDGGSTLSLSNDLIVQNGTLISNGGVIAGNGTLKAQGPVTINSGNMSAPLEAVSGTTTASGAFGQISIDNGAALGQNGDLAPNGDLTLVGGATLDMHNHFLFFQGVHFTNNGSVISSTGSGEVRFNGVGGSGGTTQTMAGSGPYTPAQPVDLHIVQQTTVGLSVGTVIDGVRTFIIDGGSTLSLTSALLVKNGTSFSNSGVISGSATFRTEGPVSLSSGNMTAPLEAASGVTTMTGTFGKITIDGGATVRETGSTSPNGDLIISIGGTLDLNDQFLLFQGPTYTNNGSVLSSASSGELRFNGINGAGGTMQAMAGAGTYDPAKPVDLHIVQFTTVVPAEGTVVDGARAFIIDGGSTLSMNSALIFKNGTTISNSGGISGTGILQTQGPVTINSGAGFTALFEAVSGITTCNGSFGPVMIDGGATILQAGSVAPNGDLTVKQGGSLDLNNQFMFFGGTTLTNNGSFTSSAGTGEFRFNGVGGSGGTTQHIASSSGTIVSSTEHIVQLTTVVQDGDVTLNSFIIDGGSTFQNDGVGQLTLAGDISNGGTISFNGSGTFCGDTAKIKIRSSVPGTQRQWNGGTIHMTDVDVQDQAGATQITAFNSVNSGNMGSNWHFDFCAVTPTDFDFDGDGRADVAVFRPSDRVWYLSRSNAGFAATQWGLASDTLAPADFDGDGKTDIGSWRGDSGDPDLSYYDIINSFNDSQRKEQFGRLNDVPIVAGDWDGDGKADLAVYRNGLSADGGTGSSQSYFFYRPSAQPGADFVVIPWGMTSDRPMRGDFDGDGKLDAAVFRPSDNMWYILQSSDGQVRYESWGLQCDTFVPADYDGDGKTDLAIIRGGVWYIKRSSDGQAMYQQFGISSDIPVPADYDGDQKTDIAVFRNGDWYILQSASGTIRYVNFGLAGDLPVESAFTYSPHCAK